jgi:hypothetical protein
MGVAVKKDEVVGGDDYHAAGDPMLGIASAETASDKNKKRKR